MPIPSSIADLSATPSSNYPGGGESPSVIDDYLRAYASIIRQVSDAKQDSATAVTLAGAQTLSNKTLDSSCSLAGNAATVVDGGISSTAKLANNIVTTAKMGREGSAGQVLTSNGAGANPSYQSISGLPVGTSILYVGTSAPAGFLKENGAAVSRTTYAALFLVIGTTYGAGDGVTTFNLPDSRGEFFRCLDDGRGVDAGRTLGAAQADELKSHTHTALVNSGQLGSGGGSNYLGQPSGTGATGGTETRPRNVARLACIKY